MKENYKVWKCLCCGVILGMIEDGKVIRIKRKDLYVAIEGGKVTVNCTQCGKPNTIEDERSSATIDIKEN